MMVIHIEVASWSLGGPILPAKWGRGAPFYLDTSIQAASKRGRIHTHLRNTVPLVWDSPRLAPIIDYLQNTVGHK